MHRSPKSQHHPLIEPRGGHIPSEWGGSHQNSAMCRLYWIILKLCLYSRFTIQPSQKTLVYDFFRGLTVY